MVHATNILFILDVIDRLFQVLVNDIPLDTEDKDVTLENEFFDDRNTFLSFCQENHYQFDTLRHAKHSSMMILDQLQKNTKLTGGPTSSVCHKDVTAEDRLRCEVCRIFMFVFNGTK